MLLSLLFVAGVALFFWQSILSFFVNTFIPWLVKTIGPVAADVFKKIVTFVKGAVKWTRLQIRKAWAWLRARVLSIKTVYKFPGPKKCVRETTSYIVSEEGNILENVTTEELAWEDIPADVRKALMKITEDEIAINARAELEENFKNQIKEQKNLTDKEVLELLA